MQHLVACKVGKAFHGRRMIINHLMGQLLQGIPCSTGLTVRFFAGRGQFIIAGYEGSRVVELLDRMAGAAMQTGQNASQAVEAKSPSDATVTCTILASCDRTSPRKQQPTRIEIVVVGLQPHPSLWYWIVSRFTRCNWRSLCPARSRQKSPWFCRPSTEKAKSVVN